MIALRNVWKKTSQPLRVQVGMNDGMIVPLVPYGCEVRTSDKNIKDWVNKLETKCSRMTCGVRMVD